MGCLNDLEIAEYVEGRVDHERRERVRSHLAGCEKCREAVHARAVVFFQESTLAGQTGASGAPLSRGSSLGRYVLVGAVGRGGMGVVYAAYDPELDRKVALKLLRPDLTAGSRAGSRREQLLNEAQAMARLNHGNVVTVYDVGTVGEQVFVAMEFVEGGTLRGWLSQPRTPAEVLAVFREAGRGLQAAHAAGIVHRDFKPENVLVAEDGRVRVTDFGLATGSGVSEGTLVGTPAYMAPEQMTGDATDARTDVFSFCAALYEGLYRQRPFAGPTLTDLREAVERGDVAPTPAAAKVPAWIRRVVLRGLKARPGERWPSMSAVLDALDPRRDPARRLRRALVAIGGLALLVAGGVAIERAVHHQRELCRLPADQPGVWSDAQRLQVREALTKAGAADAFGAVASSLDARIAAWRAMWTDACQATRVRGEQSSELLDLRMQCLDDRRRELTAVTDVLAHADADVAEHARDAVKSLTPLDGCADRRSLTLKERPPRDAAERARVNELSDRVAKARALFGAGKLDAGYALVHQANLEAKAIGYAPVAAQARYLEGMMLAERGKYEEGARLLQESAALAQRGADDEIAAWAWTGLVAVVGFHLHRIDEAKLWASYAEAAIQRLGGNQTLELDRLSHLGLVLTTAGSPDAAPVLEKVVSLSEKIYGKDNDETARAVANLANELSQNGQVAQSALMHERVWRIFEAKLGRDHIDTLRAGANLGYDLVLLGRHAEAEKILRTNAADCVRVLGADHPATATAEINLGDALEGLARHDEAIRVSNEAIAALSKLVGDAHPALVEPLTTVGLAQLGLGQRGAGKKTLERALKIGEAAKMPARDLARTRKAL